MPPDASHSRGYYQARLIPYRISNRNMELTTIVTLLIVSSILIFSVAITLGIGAKIENIYKAIQEYIRRISLGTTITIGLLIVAVLLAVVASM